MASASYYSQRLQKRMQNPKFCCHGSVDSRYKHFHCFLPTETGRSEDEYRADIYYHQLEASKGLDICFKSNMTPLEQALLDAALELFLKNQTKGAPTSKELDYFLRDKNDIPCADNAINFNAPVEVIELFQWHLKQQDFPHRYPVAAEGPFVELSLEKQLEWSEKALHGFLLEQRLYMKALDLVAIDGANIVLRPKNSSLSEKELEKLNQYLVDFFQEKKLKVITD